jgi:hypothetical protein
MAIKLEQVETSFEGYNYQAYPTNIDKLNIIYDRISWTGYKLKQVGKMIPTFQEAKQVKTSDDYYWFWGLIFKLETGMVLVTCPWRHNNRLERSCTLFIKGEIIAMELESLVELLCEKMEIYAQRALFFEHLFAKIVMERRLIRDIHRHGTTALPTDERFPFIIRSRDILRMISDYVAKYDLLLIFNRELGDKL